MSKLKGKKNNDNFFGSWSKVIKDIKPRGNNISEDALEEIEDDIFDDAWDKAWKGFKKTKEYRNTISKDVLLAYVDFLSQNYTLESK